MRRALVLCLWMALVAVFGFLARPANAGRVASKDQAIARAERFMGDVGWKGKTSASEKPDVRTPGSKKRSHWKARADTWEVSFGGRVVIELAGQDGKVVSAIRRGLLADRTEDIVRITRTTADERAERYLKAAGISLGDKRLERSGPATFEASPGGMTWNVRYRRVYKNFPFVSEGVSVSLDPRDGSLYSLGDNCLSPLPDSTSVSISNGKAEANGRKYLAEFGLTAGKLVSAELKIVQPDDFWEYWKAGSFPSADATCSRLAWDLQFDAPWEGTVVYVDAENGTVVGGGMTRTPAKSHVDLPPLTSVDDTLISQIKDRPVGRAKPKLPRPKASADYARPGVVVDPAVRLPQEGIVYKVKLQPVTEDALRRVAREFGISEPENAAPSPHGRSGTRSSAPSLSISPDRTQGTYVVDEPSVMVTIRDDGFLEYYTASTGDAAAPSEETAKAKAVEWLERSSLLPAGAKLECEPAGRRVRSILNGKQTDSVVLERTIRCWTHIPGSPVEGSYIDVQVGPGGKLCGLTRYIAEVEPLGFYPLKDIPEVVNDVRQGRAVYVSAGAEDNVKSAQVHSVRLAYEQPHTRDRVQYVLPTYVLTGEAVADGKSRPFTAKVTAVQAFSGKAGRRPDAWVFQKWRL